jgi:tetratricopeptide (TPR) repeat protein
MFNNLILNIFLSVLVFGGFSIILFVILRKMLSPKKITALRTLIKSSNYKQAIKLAKEIITKEPNNSEAHYYLAEAYYFEGKLELALIEYKATDKIGVHDKHINEIDLREKLGELYAKFDNIDEAIKEYILLHQKFPDNYLFSFKIAELFEKKGLRDPAIIHYTKSIKRNPNFVPALLNLGIILYDTKKFQEAIKLLEQAVRIENSNFKAHLYLGLLKKADNNPKGAIKHFEIAVRDKDLKVRALMEKGIILMSSNKVEEAVIELERALKNVENESQTLVLNLRYILAICYENLRNITEAIVQWEKIYSVKPDFKNVGEKLASYQDLQMDDKMKDFMTATNDEYLDICKKIVENMNLTITELNIQSNEGIEFFTLEGNVKWRNVKKKPLLIHIYRKNTPVEDAILRKVHDTMRNKEIIKAVVLSASGFTKQALAFAQERPIELFDKNGLQNIIKNINF